jgi:hypothetical protein
MELQVRFHGVGVSAVGWPLGYVQWWHELGAGVRTLGRRYGQCPARLETQDLRDVEDHIDEGAAVSGGVNGHDVSKPRVIIVS